MAEWHNVKIVAGRTPLESRVEIDGEPVNGVLLVKAELDVTGPPVVTIALYPRVLEIVGEAHVTTISVEE